VDKIFKALADRNRRLIITLLRKNQSMNVTKMLENFNIGQSTLSNHLAILRKAKLVTCEIKGKQRIYRMETNVFNAFIEELNRFSGGVSVVNDQEIIIRGNNR